MLRIRKSADSIKTAKARRQEIERVNIKCAQLYILWFLIIIYIFLAMQLFMNMNEYKLFLILL